MDISFELNGGQDYVDVDVTAFNGKEKLLIPASAFSGDLYDLKDAGTYHIVFDPSKTGYGNQVMTQVRFVVTMKESPLYMIVNLLPTCSGDRVSYLTRSQIRTGEYGEWTDRPDWIQNCSLPYTFVWTGITNTANYAKCVTTNMVFRRIPAGAFKAAGSNTNNVFLTKPLYVSVFEYTCGQESVRNGTSLQGKGLLTYLARPFVNMSYHTIRGSTNVVDGVDWPATGHGKVAGWLSSLRLRTGLMLDLPTAAQWELAYRAGTETSYYLGDSTKNATESATLIGRHRGNGGFSPDINGKWEWNFYSTSSPTYNDPTHGFAPAGQYLPNALGIYDLGGNAMEYCLDYYIEYSNPDCQGCRTGTDPVGPTFRQSLLVNNSNKGQRLVRGGSAWHTVDGLTATSSSSQSPQGGSSLYGCRFVCPVESDE